jgi:hypothetical protein
MGDVSKPHLMDVLFRVVRLVDVANINVEHGNVLVEQWQ